MFQMVNLVGQLLERRHREIQLVLVEVVVGGGLVNGTMSRLVIALRRRVRPVARVLATTRAVPMEGAAAVVIRLVLGRGGIAFLGCRWCISFVLGHGGIAFLRCRWCISLVPVNWIPCLKMKLGVGCCYAASEESSGCKLHDFIPLDYNQ